MSFLEHPCDKSRPLRVPLVLIYFVFLSGFVFGTDCGVSDHCLELTSSGLNPCSRCKRFRSITIELYSSCGTVISGIAKSLGLKSLLLLLLLFVRV